MPYTLIYCYDPMCSWCWGFKPTWARLKQQLAPLIEQGTLTIEYRTGGLAPDNDQPMPVEMQSKLQSVWSAIQQQLGTEFNFDFWQQCQPRRSTYPACRACMVARQFDQEEAMISQIQQAYYLQAKNPSDLDTLTQCATDIGIAADVFSERMQAIEQHQLLEQEVQQARQLGLNSFPSLALHNHQQIASINIDYQNPDSMMQQIEHAMAALAAEQN
ncbi:DsbA family protein [Bacterioplanoides sp.]|uniref:DsbA family protein n=1 Tax=Bacterioplanoides sp. TaxID=2066072 RepID=UPI003B5B7CF5